MKIGELVRINDLTEPDPTRLIGTIVRDDIYNGLDPSSIQGELISEVLWNDGHLSWILTNRLSTLEADDVEMDS